MEEEWIWGKRRALGGVEGGETVIGMHCMRDDSIFHKHFLKTIYFKLRTQLVGGSHPLSSGPHCVPGNVCAEESKPQRHLPGH